MYCGKCGAARSEGDDYCPMCGAAYLVSEETPQESDQATSPAPQDDPPYEGGMTLLALLLTFFMPLIALIVALVMRSGELRPKRRGFLKSWAIWSGAWLASGWVVALVLILSLGGGGGGGCKGGEDPFGIPTFSQSGNGPWMATVPCVDGGTTTRPAKPGEVP